MLSWMLCRKVALLCECDQSAVEPLVLSERTPARSRLPPFRGSHLHTWASGGGGGELRQQMDTKRTDGELSLFCLAFHPRHLSCAASVCV